MNFFKLGEFPLEQDLNELHIHLMSQKISHRITEENGVQVLWLAEKKDTDIVQDAIKALASGELKAVAETENENRVSLFIAILFWSSCIPISMAFIVLGILGYAVVGALQSHQSPIALVWYFIQFSDLLDSHQYWRLITPVFLHFSFVHVLFNSLMVWELGGRTEQFLGLRAYILFFLIVGIGSNVIQYLVLDPGQLRRIADFSYASFGGLSGVIYGYVGFILVANKKSTNPLVHVPPGFLIATIVWLFLGLFGVIDYLIEGKIANGAHFGGLILGILYGLTYFSIYPSSQEVPGEKDS